MLEIRVNSEVIPLISYQFNRRLNYIADNFMAVTTPNLSNKITIGAIVNIFYDKTLILSGFVEAINRNVDTSSISFEFSGQSKTADLTDCSIVMNFENASLATVLDYLATSFDFSYTIDFLPTEVQSIAFNGEPIIDVLATQLRNVGRYGFALPDGNLAIQKLDLSNTIGEIIEDIQFISGSVENGQSFSKFITYDKDGNQIELNNDSAKIVRYRPFTNIGDGDNSVATCEKRLDRLKAASDSFNINISLKEPRDKDNNLLKVGFVYKLNLPSLDIKGDYLLEAINLSGNVGNVNSQVTFCNPKKYEVE